MACISSDMKLEHHSITALQQELYLAARVQIVGAARTVCSNSFAGQKPHLTCSIPDSDLICLLGVNAWCKYTHMYIYIYIYIYMHRASHACITPAFQELWLLAFRAMH